MPIVAIDHAVPGVMHTAADLAAATGADEAFIRDKVGVHKRYCLGEDETGISLSQAACEALFARAPELRDQVDLLVCVTQSPDRKLPQNSAGLAHALQLGPGTASFDIALGCSGYVYALSVVEGFLMATQMENAVLVTCDPYSRIIDPTDKATNCVFGDAATATWIRRQGKGGRIVATDFGTDGSQGDAISIAGGGAAAPMVSIIGMTPPETSQMSLFMNGRAVFNFVNGQVPKSIRACLEKAGLGLDDIDRFALHQGSIYMLDAMAKRVGIPPEKLLKNMNHFGNTVSSSIPLLLYDLQQKGDLDGQRILASGFGVGLSWATAILEFEL
ncbi:ketoacyl-ACP synthase III [Actibacterium ureilyticum]|uniref:ketoacyl-ACP synthase III n=1 Tax=Actibacterium ureilyticum TaxID=1590614 RepID=UPI000BAAC4E3|nr:ketoacyl-ACP synthase III [Actibacterium ureilyticum]